MNDHPGYQEIILPIHTVNEWFKNSLCLKMINIRIYCQLSTSLHRPALQLPWHIRFDGSGPLEQTQDIYHKYML